MLKFSMTANGGLCVMITGETRKHSECLIIFYLFSKTFILFKFFSSCAPYDILYENAYVEPAADGSLDRPGMESV